MKYRSRETVEAYEMTAERLADHRAWPAWLRAHLHELAQDPPGCSSWRRRFYWLGDRGLMSMTATDFAARYEPAPVPEETK